MGTIFPRLLKLAVLVGVALPLVAATAFAADCPADKVGTDVMKPGPSAPTGVTDTVLASLDLSPKGSGFAGYKMRMRKLTIEPGGIVLWHSHEARPASIY